MIDHFTLKVRDLARAKAFYGAALAPLGYSTLMDFGDHLGMGAGGKADFWLAEDADHARPTHFAFAAPDRRTVDAFHAAALGAGGKDNGRPGIRKDFHPTYYGAFVLDSDGNNVEVVCHKPE